MHINSKDNPKIKLYKKLASNKKYRDEQGLFTIEGARNCVDTAYEALCENITIEAVFYTAQALEKYKNNLSVDDIFRCVDDDKIFEISQELADKMTDEGSSQGIFMIAKKLDIPFCEDNIDKGGKYLVLDGLQDPGNLGTLLRTADAVGVSGAVMTDNCVDLYNPKVVRSAMGSISRLKIFVVKRFEEAAELFGKVGILTAAAVVRDGESITDFDFSKPCAVVIGNEGKGLPNEHVELCDRKITITMHGNIESLNAACAGTIILWEMFRGESRG